MRIEQLTGPVAYHGEGPVWSPSWGGLRWLDMLAGDVLALTADGEVTRRHVGEVVAAVRPRRSGGAVLATARGFTFEDADGALDRLPDLWEHDGVRMNEGGCDPDGRFYCGSMSEDQETPRGTLFRLDPDRTVRPVVAQVTVSNGLEWSPRGDLAYYNDTATGRIDVFDYDPAAGLTGRRLFAEVDGKPDGLTVDAEGGVWTAVFDRGAVHRHRPDGVLDAVLDLPVRQVTACTFGGDALDRLYITTSREGLQDGDDPLAGSLFVAEPGVTGLPVRAFAG